MPTAAAEAYADFPDCKCANFVELSFVTKKIQKYSQHLRLGPDSRQHALFCRWAQRKPNDTKARELSNFSFQSCFLLFHRDVSKWRNKRGRESQSVLPQLKSRFRNTAHCTKPIFPARVLSKIKLKISKTTAEQLKTATSTYPVQIQNAFAIELSV